MSNEKKHALGRGISSLLGGDFNLDESIDNIISRNSSASSSVEDKPVAEAKAARKRSKDIPVSIKPPTTDDKDRKWAAYLPQDPTMLFLKETVKVFL